MKKIYLLFLLSILSLNIFCQVHWTKNPDPVLEPGPAGSFDQAWVGMPCVLLVDDTLRMWYSGASGAEDDSTWAVGYATSTDGGITWTKYDHNPVLNVGPVGSFDGKYVYYAEVFYHESTYHMWYVGGNLSDNEATGYATSPDGIHWTKYEGNPIDIDAPGGVLFKDNLYQMWYSYSGAGYGTSDDGIIWTKYEGNPVIDIGPPGSWDRPRLQPHSVIFDGQKFHLWYSGGAFGSWQIGYATSPDGINWTKFEGNPVLPKGSPGSLDDAFTFFSSVIFDDSNSLYKMWYHAGPGGIGYAETYEPAWELMESTDMPKGGSQSCAIDSMIYVFGGLTNSLPLYSSNSAVVYNTKTNDWSDLTPVPIDLYSTSIGVIDGMIYLAGGWHQENPWFTIDSTFAYDPESDSWEAKKECPKEAGGHASCVLNGKLYLFGGIDSHNDADTSGWKEALVYDPASDTWDSLPDMLYARTFESRACVYDGQIYVIGGIYGEWNTSGKVERYNPGNNTWTELAEMPVPESNHLCVVHNDKIYVFGGDSLWTRSPEDRTYCTNLIQEYDPLTNQWQIMESMPFNRSMMTGQKVGNYVYLIGGYPYNSRDFPSVLSEVWKFNLDSLKEWVVLCEEVLISQESLNLEPDDTYTLSACVLPIYAADRTVSWSSSDEEVATISAEGVMTAVSGGEATITATANGGGCTASCSVSVSPGVGIINSRAYQISVFPNPVIDLLNVRTGLSEYHVIEISLLNGQILYSVTTDRPSYQFDLSRLEKGAYFITIRSKDYVTTRKIIKL